MRKFLIAAAAGLIVVVTGSLTAPRADAITLALPTGMTNQLNMVEQARSASTSTAGMVPACTNVDTAIAAAMAGTARVTIARANMIGVSRI